MAQPSLGNRQKIQVSLRSWRQMAQKTSVKVTFIVINPVYLLTRPSVAHFVGSDPFLVSFPRLGRAIAWG
jgi:hypothetical protein